MERRTVPRRRVTRSYARPVRSKHSATRSRPELHRTGKHHRTCRTVPPFPRPHDNGCRSGRRRPSAVAHQDRRRVPLGPRLQRVQPRRERALLRACFRTMCSSADSARSSCRKSCSGGRPRQPLQPVLPESSSLRLPALGVGPDRVRLEPDWRRRCSAAAHMHPARRGRSAALAARCADRDAVRTLGRRSGEAHFHVHTWCTS